MRSTIFLIALGASTAPAWAAGEKKYGFFSLFNTDYTVLIGFIVFLGILFFFGVPKMIGDLLDKRSNTIRDELEEAKTLREEAQSLLASYERKAREAEEQSKRIVSEARASAEAAAEKAKGEIERSVERRLAAAQEQIASAEAKAERAVRDRAVNLAIGAAADVVAGQSSEANQAKMIDDAIAVVERQLH